ncbi:hypothetical protein [Kribbella aluminosa]|uniref:hypothetical protein n=1 Tax=Kribbella aluminosa TaxID=416017 RepID=UPI0031D52A77
MRPLLALALSVLLLVPFTPTAHTAAGCLQLPAPRRRRLSRWSAAEHRLTSVTGDQSLAAAPVRIRSRP